LKAIYSLNQKNLKYIPIAIILFVLCFINTFRSFGEEVIVEQEVVIAEVSQLTSEEALVIAVAENPKVRNAFLETKKADNAIWAIKTRLFPEFDFSLYEAYHLTDESFDFKQGAFGDFPVIGPIPAQNTSIETTPDFTIFITATASQPISQLYEISLLLTGPVTRGGEVSPRY